MTRPPPGDPHSSRFQSTPCPWCGALIDTVRIDPGHLPKLPRDGDTVLCVNCLRPSIAVISIAGMGLRQSGPEEETAFVRANAQFLDSLRAFKQDHPPSGN